MRCTWFAPLDFSQTRSKYRVPHAFLPTPSAVVLPLSSLSSFAFSVAGCGSLFPRGAPSRGPRCRKSCSTHSVYARAVVRQAWPHLRYLLRECMSLLYDGAAEETVRRLSRVSDQHRR